MARSSNLKVRRVKSKAERERPSVFMRLKTDEQFKGHALFEPDPETGGSKENPGFYEYLQHWDNSAQQAVPCAGDMCPFCKVNDNPSTRAMTLWYLPDNPENEKLKVFTMNYSTTEDVTDISEEEDGVLGKHFRVKRLSDKGEYRIRPTGLKKLTKAEMKALLKNAPDLEELVTEQLKRQWARLEALDALTDDSDDEDDTDEDDEDEEDEKEIKSRRGKSKKESKKAKDEDEDDDDDDDDDDSDSDDDDDDSDDDDDDDDSDSDDDDDDDDDSDDSDDEDDEDSDEDLGDDDDDEEEETQKGTYVVVSTNSSEETITATVDDKKTKLWVGEGVEVEYDDIVKGDSVTVDLVKDDEGDWVISKLKHKPAKSDKGGKGKGKGKTKGGKGKSKVKK